MTHTIEQLIAAREFLNTLSEPPLSSDIAGFLAAREAVLTAERDDLVKVALERVRGMEADLAQMTKVAEQYKANATENYRLGIADLARATVLADALDSALTVALDCQQRWSRGHDDRVAKAKAALDAFRADFKARS